MLPKSFHLVIVFVVVEHVPKESSASANQVKQADRTRRGTAVPAVGQAGVSPAVSVSQAGRMPACPTGWKPVPQSAGSENYFWQMFVIAF
jgi:hypothetical protein